jgi:predicted Na+-dependent transporter
VPAIAWLGMSEPGLLLVALAPGGGIGPLLALLARGDATLAGALFLVLSLAGTLVALALTLLFDIQLVDMALVAGSAIAPLLVGLIVRRRASRLATAILPWTGKLGAILLVTTVVWFAIQHAGSLALSTLGASAGLAITSVLVGWLAARWAGADRAATIAVVEISLVRNVALSLVVVTGLGGEPAAIMGVLTYALVMLVAGGALAISHRGDGPEPLSSRGRAIRASR